MLLRSTVSSTKKFFQKTLKNFKSLFSSGYYERLPKTPQHINNHFSYSVAANMAMDMDNNNSSNRSSSTSYQVLEKYHYNTNDQWDSEKEKEAKRKNKKKAVATMEHNNEVVYNNGSFLNFANAKNDKKKNQVEMKREEFESKNNKRSLTHERVKYSMMREHGNCMVEQKLRELEMLDMSNVDHVLDIEEILHYYSRLTCPAYLEIVDKFFMQMYSEFFGPAWSAAAPCSLNSRLMKLRYH